MEYKLKLKRKRFSHPEIYHTLPFPLAEEGKAIPCIWNGFSVEVIDSSYFAQLYDNGCFGKGSISRSVPNILIKSFKSENFKAETDIVETLVLDLEEAFLLSNFVKAIEVKNVKEEKLNNYDLFAKFCSVKSNFIDSMIVYLYLKSNDWIVKNGIKFGVNFLIYKTSVRLYHASFAVIIDNDSTTTRNMQVIQRVAESADKDVMLLRVYKPDDIDITNLHEVFCRLTDFKVQQVILKRFDLNMR